MNALTDSRRSPGAQEQMSPCGCPPAPQAFVMSDDEHLRTPAPSVCVPTSVSTVPAASGELRVARRAFLPDSGGPTSIDMCTSPEHESQQLRGNRFAVLSREEDFPHGQAGQGVPRRRLVLTNMESGVVRSSVHILSNTGSDTESMGEVEARPRGGGFQVHRDVQSADFLTRSRAQDRIRPGGWAIAKTVASAEVVSQERPIDVGRSWDRSVHTCVGLVGGGPRGNSRSVGIPRRVHRTQRSSSSRVGLTASGNAELGRFSCRRFDDLGEATVSLCKGSRTHHDGSLQGGCQGGIARGSFRCSGAIQRKTDGVASDDPGKGSCSASVKEIPTRARWLCPTRELGEFGRCRFGRHISANRSHVAVMSSFPSRSASILFFFGSPRTNKSQTGRRRESRNASVEIVRIDPNDVVAQTTREWFCWTRSVGTPRRPVCARGLGQSVACCTTKFVQMVPTQRVE